MRSIGRLGGQTVVKQACLFQHAMSCEPFLSESVVIRVPFLCALGVLVVEKAILSTLLAQWNSAQRTLEEGFHRASLFNRG